MCLLDASQNISQVQKILEVSFKWNSLDSIDVFKYLFIILQETHTAESIGSLTFSMCCNHLCLHITTVDVVIIVEFQHGCHGALPSGIDPALALENIEVNFLDVSFMYGGLYDTVH